MNKIYFERAIFISWFCSKPTCKFCYMHLIRNKIKNPRKARRRVSSILAESLICKLYNWRIGFISSGIASWSTVELKRILAGIYEITKEKQWLNVGVLKEKQIRELLPYIKGLTGTLETPNFEIRNHIVPDKPLEEINEMFRIADKYGLKKTITIIIGLGEKIEDFENLKHMIKKWRVDRINFYRLVPHNNIFNAPETKYYARWIALTRENFPEIEIVAGSWPDKVDEIPELISAGATSITKFPAIKLFGSEYAFKIKRGVEKAGREFASNLTEIVNVNITSIVDKLELEEELKKKIIARYTKYLGKMKKSLNQYLSQQH